MSLLTGMFPSCLQYNPPLSAQLSSSLLHEALLDHSSRTFLRVNPFILHTIHNTPPNVLAHYLTDWSLCFSVIFSTSYQCEGHHMSSLLYLTTHLILSLAAGTKLRCMFLLAHGSMRNWKPLRSITKKLRTGVHIQQT